MTEKKDEDAILLEKREGMAILIINRPEKANALRLRDYQRMARLVEEVDKDDNVRVIILTAAGSKVFTSGDDFTDYAGQEISDARKMSQLQQLKFPRPLLEPGLVLWKSLKPSIAAINGACLAPEWLWWCDLRVMADHAFIQHPDVQTGVSMGAGGSQLLPRMVGRARAMEILLLAERISAEDAYRMGLVNKVVPLDELMPTAENWAKQIMKGFPTAVALTRWMVNAAQDMPLEQGAEWEKWAADRCLLTGDLFTWAESYLKARGK